jgi:hypothetical protein
VDGLWQQGIALRLQGEVLVDDPDPVPQRGQNLTVEELGEAAAGGALEIAEDHRGMRRGRVAPHRVVRPDGDDGRGLALLQVALEIRVLVEGTGVVARLARGLAR